MNVLYIVIIVLLIILLMPIGVTLDLHNSNIKVRLILFNIIKITIFEKDKTKQKAIKVLEKRKQKKQEKSIFKRVKETISFVKRIDFKGIFYLLRKNINTNTSLKCEFGFERRDFTAILYGVLSSMFPIIKNSIDQSKGRHRFKFLLLPSFSKKPAAIDFNLEAKTNVFKIILIIFIVIKENLISRNKTNNN